MTAEAFEAGYRNGLAIKRAQHDHDHAREAFRAGLTAGQAWNEAEMDHCSAHAVLMDGFHLGVEHADYAVPDGLASAEAVVWLAVARHAGVDRSRLHGLTAAILPMSIGRVDALRRDLQRLGLIVALRDGRQTTYAARASS